jgi:hypothetical protein
MRAFWSISELIKHVPGHVKAVKATGSVKVAPMRSIFRPSVLSGNGPKTREVTQMSDDDSMPENLKNSGHDHAVVASKALLGIVPFAGSILAELAGSAIPNQRLDRVAKFAAELDRRLVGIESEVTKQKWNDDRFLELAEEVVRQAARATSDQRREYLATLLSAEMTREQIDEHDGRHLLRILGELNDVEVVWLRHYAGNSFRWHYEFQDLHREILDLKVVADYPSDDARMAASALKESYLSHLVQLGLMEDHLSVNANGIPEMEWGGRKFRVRREITHLGAMLLELIGFEPFRQARLTEFEQ